MSTNYPGTPENNSGGSTPESTPGGYWDNSQTGADANQSGFGAFPDSGFPEQPQAAAVTVAKPGVGDALSYAFNKFKNNWQSWVLFTLIFGAVNAVAMIFTLMGSPDTDASGLATEAPGAMYWIGMLLSIVASVVLTPFLLHGAFLEVSGRKPALGDFFKATDRIIPVLLVSILVGLITIVVVGIPFGIIFGIGIASESIGMLFFGVLVYIVLMFVVLIFTAFATYSVVGDAKGPIAALKTSFGIGKSHAGAIILLGIVIGVLTVIAAIPFGLGLLVMYPVSTIAYAYFYRAATGGQISAV